MVRFSASPKNEPRLLLLRARSARKTSVFNQKTMFLGYAHSSITYSRARFARKKGEVVHFSAKPKNEPPLLFSSEASAKILLFE
ncbi:MAG: hypothetical protein U5L45_21520 [Saprospiraceae bacterium]|nr:hypothetical protein [Saprospiraceae bacterium]